MTRLASTQGSFESEAPDAPDAPKSVLLPPPRPVAAVYTFAVIADGSRRKELSKPHHSLDLYSAKDLTLQWVARYAEIPFGFHPLVFFRKQLVIFGYHWNGTVVFQDDRPPNDRPSVFSELPEKVRAHFGSEVETHFEKYSWQLIEAWNSPSPDRELDELQQRMLPHGQRNEYEAIDHAMSSSRARRREL